MSAGLIPETNRSDWARHSARSFVPGWVESAAAVMDAARRAWRRRRDRIALARLDDRALSDIGIGPSEIGHALRRGQGRDEAERRTEPR